MTTHCSHSHCRPLPKKEYTAQEESGWSRSTPKLKTIGRLEHGCVVAMVLLQIEQLALLCSWLSGHPRTHAYHVMQPGLYTALLNMQHSQLLRAPVAVAEKLMKLPPIMQQLALVSTSRFLLRGG